MKKKWLFGILQIDYRVTIILKIKFKFDETQLKNHKCVVNKSFNWNWMQIKKKKINKIDTRNVLCTIDDYFESTLNV